MDEKDKKRCILCDVFDDVEKMDSVKLDWGRVYWHKEECPKEQVSTFNLPNILLSQFPNKGLLTTIIEEHMDGLVYDVKEG